MRQQENIGNGVSKIMEDKKHSLDGVNIDYRKGLFKSKQIGA